MKKIIHKLRQQPEEVRTQILHLLTIFFAVVMFVLWVYSLSVNLTDQDTQTNIKNDLEPLSDIKSNLIEGYSNELPDPSVLLGE